MTHSDGAHWMGELMSAKSTPVAKLNPQVSYWRRSFYRNQRTLVVVAVQQILAQLLVHRLALPDTCPVLINYLRFQIINLYIMMYHKLVLYLSILFEI